MTNAIIKAQPLPLARLGPEALLEACKTHPDQAAATISALVRLNTDMMPDTVFVRRGADGTLKKVRTRVALRESEGHLVSFNRRVFDQGKWVETRQYSIAAAGFRHLNAVIGLHLMTPNTVVVNDKLQPNPYVEVDAKTNRPTRVWCRSVAIGPSPVTGNLVATDVMLRYDLDLYLLENILAKVKREENKFKKDDKPSEALWAEYGGEADKPTTHQGRWKFFPLIAGDVGIWVNLSSPQMKAILGDHLTKVKFADRTAQTIAARNAMKAHPSMPSTAGEAQNGLAYVTVTGWTSSMSIEEIKTLQRLADENRLHERVDVEEHRVQAEDEDKADIEADVREAAVAEGRTPDEDEQDETDDRPDAAPDEAPVDHEALVAEALDAYQRYQAAHGKKAARAKLAEAGVAEVAEANDEQLKQIAGWEAKS